MTSTSRQPYQRLTSNLHNLLPALRIECKFGYKDFRKPKYSLLGVTIHSKLIDANFHFESHHAPFAIRYIIFCDKFLHRLRRYINLRNNYPEQDFNILLNTLTRDISELHNEFRPFKFTKCVAHHTEYCSFSKPFPTTQNFLYSFTTFLEFLLSKLENFPSYDLPNLKYDIQSILSFVDETYCMVSSFLIFNQEFTHGSSIKREDNLNERSLNCKNELITQLILRPDFVI